MGRCKEKPRCNVISFRVTDEEHVRIIEAAVGSKRDKGTLARELVLEGIRNGERGSYAEIR